MVIAMDCSVAVLILNTDINSGKFRLVVTFLFVLTHVTGTIEKEGVRQGKWWDDGKDKRHYFEKWIVE